MSFLKQWRMPLLVITNAFAILVLGKVILDPSIVKDTSTTFEFPSVVPLPQWQLIESKALPGRNLRMPGKQYRYIQNQLPLDIDIRYVIETDGNIKQLIGKHTSINFSTAEPTLRIRQQPGVGFYGVYVDQERAYLDACINARGSSTFTSEQFIDNRKRYELQFNRLLAYLIADQSLRERRCLWSHLSIPLNDSSTETAYHNLETAWFSWYKWWSPRFPK
ncbi:MAG TPA: cyanoexosortase A system-associated protein [Oculatellaceae cyanobacterium]|jgi:cyanosortase A-associated protein